jgi:hypothetical protein
MKISVFCLCWLLILSGPGVMAQQAEAPNQSWDALRKTLVSGNAQVERKDGRKFSGEIIKVSDTELEINRKGKLESFRRDEVKKVRLVARPRNRNQYQAVGWISGFLVGAGIALELGFKECGDGCGDEKAGMAAALIALPVVCLFIGRALAGKTKRALIYSAP